MYRACAAHRDAASCRRSCWTWCLNAACVGRSADSGVACSLFAARQPYASTAAGGGNLERRRGGHAARDALRRGCRSGTPYDRALVGCTQEWSGPSAASRAAAVRFKARLHACLASPAAHAARDAVPAPRGLFHASSPARRATRLRLSRLPRGRAQPCEALGAARSVEQRACVRWVLATARTIRRPAPYPSYDARATPERVFPSAHRTLRGARAQPRPQTGRWQRLRRRAL